MSVCLLSWLHHTNYIGNLMAGNIIYIYFCSTSVVKDPCPLELMRVYKWSICSWPKRLTNWPPVVLILQTPFPCCTPVESPAVCPSLHNSLWEIRNSGTNTVFLISLISQIPILKKKKKRSVFQAVTRGDDESHGHELICPGDFHVPHPVLLM